MAEELAFEGLKVLDLSQGVAAPYCGMLLAQNGADVIKVEPHAPGDWSRAMGKPYGDHSASSVILCRGKRSLGLDLKKPKGVAIAKRLAREADVILQNYRPGVIEKFGLDYESAQGQPDRHLPFLTGSARTAQGQDPATILSCRLTVSCRSTAIPRNAPAHRLLRDRRDHRAYSFQAVSSALYRRARRASAHPDQPAAVRARLPGAEDGRVPARRRQGRPIGAPVGTSRRRTGTSASTPGDPHFRRCAGCSAARADRRSALCGCPLALPAARICWCRARRHGAPAEGGMGQDLSTADILNAPVNDYGNLFAERRSRRRHRALGRP
jgi:hypothetical protein